MKSKDEKIENARKEKNFVAIKLNFEDIVDIVLFSNLKWLLLHFE